MIDFELARGGREELFIQCWHDVCVCFGGNPKENKGKRERKKKGLYGIGERQRGKMVEMLFIGRHDWGGNG